MNPSPNTEERIWAVLSHLSALAFGMGLFLPILAWSEQRRKSKYVSFQSLQALGYQSLGYTLWLLTYIVLIILLTVVLMFTVVNAGNDSTAIMAWTAVFVTFIFGFMGLYLLFPVIAAVACGFGKDFRYPILGTRLAKYLGLQQANHEPAALIEEHEERWVASMGHFSVIIALWGLIAPVATWILQGRHSAFLKFQSIQTTIYQAIVNLLYLGAGGVYIVGLLVTFASMILSRTASTHTPAGIFSLVVFFVSFAIAALIVLAIPLFHILGQWAGYRVLKGENYRYPILGKMVERRLSKSYGAEQPAVGSSDKPSDALKESA